MTELNQTYPNIHPVMDRCSFGGSTPRWCPHPATFYKPDSIGSNGCHYGFCDEHVRPLIKHGYIQIPSGAERRG